MKNLLVFISFLLLSASAVQADMSQYGQYGGYGGYGGGTPTSSIVINKKVSTGVMTKGGQMTYVENYTAADPRLKPGDKVYFTIKIKNTSDVTQNNVRVTDILPSQLDAVEGPGTFNATKKVISWTYPSLKAGEGKIETVVAIVRAQDILPEHKGLMCLTNKATVQTDTAYDDDTAQFCVEKQVIGVVTSPKAGPEYGIAFAALNGLGLAAGVYLKRKI